MLVTPRILQRAGQIVQKSGGLGSIHDAMVARKRDRHDGTYARQAAHSHHSIGDSSHGQNRGLWRRDDGAERVDSEHTQVADGKRPASDIGGPQASGFGALRKIFPLRSDLSEQ